MQETLALAEQSMSEKRLLRHTVVNVAKLVNMRTDKNLAKDVTSSDIINLDGMGVVWGAQLCGLNVRERVSGVDLMENLFRLCAERGFRPFLLGAERSVLDLVMARLQRELPSLNIAGTQDGYFPKEQEPSIVDAIHASEADCLFVAMPSPTKERFLGTHAPHLGTHFIMGVGGSFDVFAGKVKRAPRWMQNLGLEWFFRLAQEPARMWKRYLRTNTAYMLLLVREIWRTRFRSSHQSADP